jgi:hypothetical protein
VRIVLIDAVTGERTTLIADDAEGSIGGDIFVRGAVRMEDVQGTISGRNLQLNLADETGTILEARVNAPGLRVGGAKVELLPGRIIKATNATFTTCQKEERPDYRITAREIEVNVNRRKVKARHVTFYLGRTRIISLPSLERSFNKRQSTPLPLPGYSGTQGAHARLKGELISTPSTSLDYSLLLSLRGNLEGAVAYERDLGHTTEEDDSPRQRIGNLRRPMRSALELTPPPTLKSLAEPTEDKKRLTVYALAALNTVTDNRKTSGLRVSRLPEIGIQFTNLMNRAITEDEPAGTLGDLSNFRRWLINGEASAGFLHERPTNARAARAGVHADGSSPLIPLAGQLFGRVGLSTWAHTYSSGSAYLLLAPEVEANYFLEKNRLIGVGFRNTLAAGRTPFAFDRRDVTHALTVRYGFSGTKWAYDFSVLFDLGRRRAYDTSLRLVKRTDCLEYGFGYSTRDQSFDLVLNLLPAAPRTVTTSAQPKGR